MKISKVDDAPKSALEVTLEVDFQNCWEHTTTVMDLGSSLQYTQGYKVCLSLSPRGFSMKKTARSEGQWHDSAREMS